ncbi:MAG TPA: hypothetical protein VJL07_06380, partial [Dehalococcoidia bacterium]|nr:hypothetical protein [Dehalococcoidia bacterium]
MNWKLPERRQLYAITGVAVPSLVVGSLLLLWVAGAFGGRGDEETQVECSPCPSATTTRTPRSFRAQTVPPTPSPCCTPTLAPTAPPPPPPTSASYGLAPFLSSDAFSRIVDFAVIPGTGNSEAIAVSQTDERILRVSLT